MLLNVANKLSYYMKPTGSLETICLIAIEAIPTNPGENAKEDPNQNTDKNSCENAK